MKHHPLDALLKPGSVAIVGASDKPDSNGFAMLRMCGVDGFDGRIYPVNPRLTEIEGLPCHPRLDALPEVPDHVIIGVASRFVEDILDQAIALGIRSATIFASCYLDGDTSPALPERIARKARAAGMALCGPNCMGFYNPLTGLRVASMPSPAGIRRGGIAWIAQSGSTFGALAHNDRRLGFSLCVSTGMERVTTVSDYMDWALEQPETRVIGLFLESVRDPEGFVAALRKARDREIPVVALKVGRTEKSAQMAVSHTGALAGNDAAYQALFRKYGVTRVADMDEMAATLAFFDTPRRPAEGKVGTIHDSGGERELAVDLAEELGLDFAELTPATCAALARVLEPGLHAENPLDAYGTNTDITNRFAEMTATLVNDPNVALGLFLSDPRDGYHYAEQYTAAVRKAATLTEKPLALVTNYSMTDERELAQSLLPVGVPLLRGTRNALLAARHVMAYRDVLSRAASPAAPELPAAAHWRERLLSGGWISEEDGLRMLADFGLSTPGMAAIRTEGDIAPALRELAFPLALKTAEEHAHKSDIGGVVLGISSADMALTEYRRMAQALGPRALFMEMAPPGVELAFGAVSDPGFGPVVLVSAGGVLIELLKDSVAALPPFDAEEAKRLISSLRIAGMLKGVRGKPAADLEDLARQLSAFSHMVAGLGDTVSQIDVNPVICGPHGAVAVDCFVVPAVRA